MLKKDSILKVLTEIGRNTKIIATKNHPIVINSGHSFNIEDKNPLLITAEKEAKIDIDKSTLQDLIMNKVKFNAIAFKHVVKKHNAIFKNKQVDKYELPNRR